MERTTTRNFNKVMPTLMACIMVLLFSSSSLAQPCKPDCPNDNWSGLQTAILDLDYEGVDISCEVEVDYRTRYACQSFHDVFIEEIRFNKSADCPFDMDDQSLAFHLISNEFVKANPMGFPEPNKPNNTGEENCKSNWRVVNGSCWYNIENEKFSACNTDKCCLERYRVCINACGEKTVEGLNPSNGTGAECDEPGCDLVCE